MIEETDLSNDEATEIAARAVQSAVKRDTGSGNGVVLADRNDCVLVGGRPRER